MEPQLLLQSEILGGLDLMAVKERTGNTDYNSRVGIYKYIYIYIYNITICST